MKTVTTITELQDMVSQEKTKGSTIGLVPSMGYLHDGHLRLIHEARNKSDLVILSIFVNPLQFGPNEDFDQYPRNFEQDERLARQHGVDILFSPSTEEMYPNEPAVKVTVTKRTDVLCGKSRPGHFDGVATVLTKLFHIAMPDVVFFGIKDAQQVAVVDGLITDFNFPVSLEAIQTVREEDGLAKSSRNVHLSSEERKQAPVIYQSLLLGKKMIETGDDHPSHVKKAVESFIEKNAPLGDIDYVDLLSYPELKGADNIAGTVILAAAVKFKGARLIDNVVFNADHNS